MSPLKPKVFGVGLNKTGTTTLGAMGRELGYTCTSWDYDLLADLKRGDLSRLFDVADRHDWFEDLPWPLAYRELDDRYPGSRFVLTVRKSPQAWLASTRRHSLLTAVRKRDHRTMVYGATYPHGNGRRYIDVYNRHNQQVRDYFAGRDDLLEMCFETGDGWPELCGFLGEPVPAAPTPHANPAHSWQAPLKRRMTNLALARAGQVKSVFDTSRTA